MHNSKVNAHVDMVSLAPSLFIRIVRCSPQTLWKRGTASDAIELEYAEREKKPLYEI